MNVNDSNTKSDPISGATTMSDTKILSAKELTCLIFNGPNFNTLAASHAAQAKRIEELESQLVGMVPVIYADLMEKERDAAIQRAEAAETREKEAHGVAGVCVNLFKGFQMLSEGKITEADFESIAARSEKDLTRGAEWLNGYVGTALTQLAAIQAALPAERALEIASKLYHRTNSPEAVNALRAYAAALTMKEPS